MLLGVVTIATHRTDLSRKDRVGKPLDASSRVHLHSVLHAKGCVRKMHVVIYALVALVVIVCACEIGVNTYRHLQI